MSAPSKPPGNVNVNEHYIFPDYGVIPVFGHTNTGKSSAALTLINLYYSTLPDVAFVHISSSDHSDQLKEQLESKCFIKSQVTFRSTDKTEEQLDDLLKHHDRTESNTLVFLFDDLQQHQPTSLKWIQKHTNTSRHSRCVIFFTAHSLDAQTIKGFFNNVLMSAEKMVITVHKQNGQLLHQFERKKVLNIEKKTIEAIKKLNADLYPFIILDIASQSVTTSIFTTIFSTDCG